MKPIKRQLPHNVGFLDPTVFVDGQSQKSVGLLKPDAFL